MINPARGKIYCEVLSEDTYSKSGLIKLARTVKEIPRRGKVITVGKPEKDKKGKVIAPCAEVGDIVHFKKSFGVHWEKDGAKYVFLRNDEITGRETA